MRIRTPKTTAGSVFLPRRASNGAWAMAILALVAVSDRGIAAAAKPEGPSTIEVKRGTLRVVFRIPGVVDAGSKIAVQARVEGEVLALPVKLGQTVKKDQPLIEIDPRVAQRGLDRAKADLLEALALERIARTRLARETSRFGEAVEENRSDRVERENAEPSTYTIELLRQELALREAATSRTRVALEEAKGRLADTRLASPINGVITEINVTQNQYISRADCERAKPLLVVADLSKIAVNAEINQSQVRDVQLNLAASVALPAFPDRIFPGRIVSISPKGFSRGEEVLFPTRIELEGDPGDAARPGLSAFCEIVAIEKPNVLLLDNAAIRRAGLRTSVVVLDQGKPVARAVKLGRTDGAVIEVLEGLREGEQVVLP